jgi:hypothetical protein
MRSRPLIAVAVLALLACSCGGGDDAATSPQGAAAAETLFDTTPSGPVDEASIYGRWSGTIFDVEKRLLLERDRVVVGVRCKTDTQPVTVVVSGAADVSPDLIRIRDSADNGVDTVAGGKPRRCSAYLRPMELKPGMPVGNSFSFASGRLSIGGGSGLEVMSPYVKISDR